MTMPNDGSGSGTAGLTSRQRRELFLELAAANGGTTVADVADRATQRLPADLIRTMIAPKMHVLDEAIRLEQLQFAAARNAHRRAVVAHPGDHASADRKVAREPRDQIVLVQIAQVLGVHSGKKRITTTETPLKQACIRIGAHSEPVSS